MILHSRLPKGWTARTPKSGTHAEFPGTAVLWDDEYYEVLAADPLPAGGVRYVLEPWRDDHTIRTFEAYTPESEARLLADHEKAVRQRRHSLLARCSGIVLGHLPAPVQNRLADELGVFPARMTLLSLIPSLVLLGTCVWLYAGARLEKDLSPVPTGLWLFAMYMLADSAVRFLIAMSQNRGTGSLPGTVLYALFWLLAPKRWNLVPPFEKSRGEKLFMLAPSEEVAQHDSVEWRSWMLTLLPPAEQHALARRYDYDYRKHASGLAWALLAVGAVGVLASIPKLETISGLVSLVIAVLIVLEQSLRLRAFRQGPAGSIFGLLVRPFVRDLLLHRQPPTVNRQP